jgi:hypothetical protein
LVLLLSLCVHILEGVAHSLEALLAAASLGFNRGINHCMAGQADMLRRSRK